MYILNILQYKYITITFLYKYNLISYNIFIDMSSLCMLPIIYKVYITPNISNYIYYLLLIFTNTIKFTPSNIYIGSSLIIFNNLLVNYKISNYYRLFNECIFSVLNSILLFYVISKIALIPSNSNNNYIDYNNTHNQCYINIQ